MFAKAEQFVAEGERRASVKEHGALPPGRRDAQEDKSSEDDMPGPALPKRETAAIGRGTRSGPAIPNIQDLELRRGWMPQGAASSSWY